MFFLSFIMTHEHVSLSNQAVPSMQAMVIVVYMAGLCAVHG